MPFSFRFIPLLTGFLIFAVTATSCQEPDAVEPGIEVEVAPDDNVEQLLGTWVLVQQSGQAPERVYTVTFTSRGEYIVQSETHAAQRQHYTLVGEDMISITDDLDTEAERFVYDLSEDRLTLTVPGTDNVAVLERREDLLEQRHDLRPRVPVDPDPARIQQDEPVEMEPEAGENQ